MNRNFLNARIGVAAIWLAAVWLVFVLRGVFYCNLIPLWEGFDEWGHYAFVEHLRLHGGSLPRKTDGVTEEIRQSVQAAPIRHEASDPMVLFEAQQPPLYYWILSAPNRIWLHADISTRVHRLRILTVLIASLTIPFAWLAALELFGSRRIALCVCGLIAVMPGLTVDIARIGNEGLAIALASWIIALLLRRKAPALGVAVGLGLLAKAYLLVFIPLLILRRRFYSLGVAIAIGGWWYARNLILNRTWTGETIDVAATKLGWSAKFLAIGNVHWLRVLDVVLWTHIWTGAWSFFTLRSWMYRAIEVALAIAAMMVVFALVRRPMGRFKGKLALLSALEVLFALGIAYLALATFLVKNIDFAPGWYFYAMVVAEVLLLTSGVLILVGRRRVLLAMGLVIAVTAALDVYSATILSRHY